MSAIGVSATQAVRGGRRIRRLLFTLLGRVGRWTSPGVAETLGGGATLLGALVRPRRLRQALAWARLHRARPAARWALALRVLANRGRFLALWAVFRSGPPDPRRVLLHGKEHLDAVHGRGAILLTFHLGPGLTGRVLRDCGYLTRGTGEPSDLVRPTIPTRSQEFPRPVQWQRDDVASRGVGLLRARGHLLAGALLRITADGGAGQAAFEVPLPGLAFTVRTGWWALRRQTGVSALPTLVRREGRRFVVDIHPPLPDPAEDPEQDKARCREVLTELLGDYVRRFPDQCVSLALSSSYGHALR